MARFSNYLDEGYLPGEVYASSLGASAFNPQSRLQYAKEKSFKFKPKTDSGEYFQQFLALQNNPQLLGQQAFGSSPEFFNAMSMFGQ
jgi:hypothetical protein